MDKERLIANYVLNKLSEEEKIQFNRLLETDSNFREQVEFETKLKKSLFESEHHKMKAQLQSIERNNYSKKHHIRWYWLAASIVILLSLGVFWTFNSTSNDTLFEHYYQTASNTSQPIVRSTVTASDAVTMAYIAYESEEYQKAQNLFAEAYTKTNASELLFYQGICQLETGNNLDAIQTLKKHQTFKDNLLDKSQWYLALAFVKIDKTFEARRFLTVLAADSSNYKYKEAKELLSKL